MGYGACALQPRTADRVYKWCSMLGRKRRERKGIEKFLVEQLDSAARDYDKRLPSRLWPIFRRRHTRFNWLELHPLAIMGFRHVVGGAVRAAMPHDIFYDIATSVVVTTFEGYFNDASSSRRASDKSDAVLSFRLVRSDDVPRKVKDEVGRMRQKFARPFLPSQHTWRRINSPRSEQHWIPRVIQ